MKLLKYINTLRLKSQICKKNRGVTLVEIVISVAILGILAITILPVFTWSFSGVAKAGRKTAALQDNSAATENVRANRSITGIPGASETDNVTINVGFPDSSADFSITGKQVQTSKAVNGETITITSFIPD